MSEIPDEAVEAALNVKPFEDGDESVQYILIRGLSAIGINLVTPASWDVMHAALEAAMTARPTDIEEVAVK